MKDSMILLLAQGFGAGRIPVAPGTFGSAVGLLWLAVCLAGGNFTSFFTTSILGILIAVPVCSRAEILLGQKDPSSVVLDEIVAVPLCYLGWFACDWGLQSKMPSWIELFEGPTVWLTLGCFASFRLLDALKPGPISRLQRLHGGWGVVVDDLAAGAATGIGFAGLRWLLCAL
jgi:phosphatidylglycerophosphatase A